MIATILKMHLLEFKCNRKNLIRLKYYRRKYGNNPQSRIELLERRKIAKLKKLIQKAKNIHVQAAQQEKSIQNISKEQQKIISKIKQI